MAKEKDQIANDIFTIDMPYQNPTPEMLDSWKRGKDIVETTFRDLKKIFDECEFNEELNNYF